MDEVTPASLQQAWEFARSTGRVAATNLAVGWTLVGDLHLAAARGAVRDIVRRHEILRSSVTELDGTVVQVVGRQLRLRVPLIDLTCVRRDRRAREMQLAITARLRRPFRMDQLPQLRAAFLRVGARQHVLVLVVSHTIWDAASAEIFLSEFLRSYAARVDRGCSPPPELTVQLGDLADWESRGTALPDDTRAHWNEKAAWLPSGQPEARHPERQSPVMAAGMPTLPGWTVSRLRHVVQQAKTTPAIGLAAGMAAALYTTEGERRQVVAIARDARAHPETRKMIGYLIDYVPLEVTLFPETSFRDIAMALRDEFRKASAEGITMTRLRTPWTEARPLAQDSSNAVAVNPVPTMGELPERPGDIGLEVAPFRPATWWNVIALDGLWECGVLNVGFAPAEPTGAVACRLCFDTRRLDIASAEQLGRDLGILLRLLLLRPDAPLAHVQRLAARLHGHATEQAFGTPIRASGLLARRADEVGPRPRAARVVARARSGIASC